jgi:FkbM family methyltransferase
MTFSFIVGDRGRVIVIEPDPDNVANLRRFVEVHARRNVTIVDTGAWSETTTLRFLSDPDHPATNLVEAVYDASRPDMSRYSVSEVKVDTLDRILEKNGVDRFTLLSVTTNGAENQILKGLSDLRRAKYISVVGSRKNFNWLAEEGFASTGDDDRGFMFERRDLV